MVPPHFATALRAAATFEPAHGGKPSELTGPRAAVLLRAQEGLREPLEAAFPASATLCAPISPLLSSVVALTRTIDAAPTDRPSPPAAGQRPWRVP